MSKQNKLYELRIFDGDEVIKVRHAKKAILECTAEVYVGVNEFTEYVINEVQDEL